MTPGFHKPGDERPRRDDRDNDRRGDTPREERPARFERTDDDGARDDRGGDRGPRHDEGSNVGRGYGKAAPREGGDGFRQNRWAPRQDRDDRGPRGRDDGRDFRQNDRDFRQNDRDFRQNDRDGRDDRGGRGGFGGGERRGSDRYADERGSDNRSSGGRGGDDAGGGGYQGRPYGGDNIGRGYGKGRPDAGAPGPPREERGGFDRDDRRGGYPGRDDRDGGYRGRGERSGGYRGRDDRDGGGYQQRDDRSGGYQQRDDRSGGYRGRDDRDEGGYQQRDDRSGGYRGRDDRNGGGYQQRDDFRGRDDRYGGYRGRTNDYDDRDQRGGYDRDQGGGFDRRGGGQESRSQEWKRMARNDGPDSRGGYGDRGRFDDRRTDNRFDDRRANNRFDDRRSSNRFDDRRGRYERGSDRRDDDSRGFGESEDSRKQSRSRAPKPDDKRRYKPPTPPNLDKDALQEPIRLNKFVARSTRYSRKESDDLVKRGRVTVNGEVVGPGTMVEPGDVVLFDEKPISRRDHLVYILINKPRGVEAAMAAPAPAPEATDADAEAAAAATGEESADDPTDGSTWENDDDQRAAGTLTQVLKFKGTEQLEVVHPLEAEMLGLQLVSNDPELGKHFAKHLPKESFTLDLAEPLAEDALTALPRVEGNQAGILLAEFINEERTKVSIVIRGAFPSEELDKAGIAFEKADRLHFAGLTKKDLPRGHWRFLGEREITWVTMFQQ